MPDLSEDLAPSYLEWLRLVAEGLDGDEIALRLGIPSEALETFARIAASKVLRLSIEAD